MSAAAPATPEDAVEVGLPHKAETMPHANNITTDSPSNWRTVVTALGAATVGSTIEWYDFLLFGVVSGLVFEKAFVSPHLSHAQRETLVQTTFFVGFLTRPIGGAVAGHYGDRVGRKAVLITTLVIMGLSTFALGCIPSYDHIGNWSYGLLVLFRCIQGLSLGGEWAGGVVLAYEYAPPKHRGLFAAIPQVGLALGLFFSSGTVALLAQLPGNSFETYGWRIAFMLSALLVGVGLIIRLSVAETPAFKKAFEHKQTVSMPFIEVLRRDAYNTLLSSGALYIDGLAFNVLVVWCIPYLTEGLHVHKVDVLGSISLAAVLIAITFPFSGHLGDLVGRRRVFVVGCLLGAISGFVAFSLLDATSPAQTWKVYLAFGLSFGLFYGPISGGFPGFVSDVFPVNVRYTGLSFAYQFSRIYGSGLTPLVISALYRLDKGHTLYVQFYMLAVGFFSAGCAALMRPPKHDDGMEDDTVEPSDSPQ